MRGWLRSRLQPYVSSYLTSEVRLERFRRSAERSRQRAGRPHELTVFLKLDDPYSYLLAQALPDLQARFEVEIDAHLTDGRDEKLFPEPDKFQRLALSDATALARLYGFDPPGDDLPDPVGLAMAQQICAFHADKPDVAAVFREAAGYLWRGDKTALMDMARSRPMGLGEPSGLIAVGDDLLRDMGHYLSATVYYEGEWYWGVDRLDHLERRLGDVGAGRESAAGAPAVRYDATWRNFLSGPRGAGRDGPPLELYFSARSPYTAIVFERVRAFARHYGIDLQTKPVLPMVMRGLPVPAVKSRYIIFDAAREARKLGAAFGSISDPLGAGVERCYALVEFARNEGKLEDFLSSFMRGVWAEGINAATDRGMRRIVARTGLDWQSARPLLDGDDWRGMVERNQQDLDRAGLWGVPGLVRGDLATWGQDRLWRIEEAVVAGADRTRGAMS